jgi:hypothetical protein
MGQVRGRSWRWILLCAITANIAAFVLAIGLGGFTLGFASLGLKDFYHELDLAGVIDHQKLSQFQNGRYATDWSTIPNTMNAPFLELWNVILIACILMFINGLFLVLLWFQLANAEKQCVNSNIT